jgi:hypothetical protein
MKIIDEVLGAPGPLERVILAPDVLRALAGCPDLRPASPSGIYPPFLCGVPVEVDKTLPAGEWKLVAP